MTGRAEAETWRAAPPPEGEAEAPPDGRAEVAAAPPAAVGRLMLTPSHRVNRTPLALRKPISGEVGATLRAAVAGALRDEIGRGLDGPLGCDIAEALRPIVREEVRRALASDDL